jgi:DNA-binding GntR family transcriptional regulator
VTAKDVREVCQVRRSLECLATRQACGRIDPDRLRAIAGEVSRLTADAPDTTAVALARDTDDRLHDLIASSCGNGFLAAELARLKILFRAYRDVAWELEEARKDFHRITVEAREHLVLIEALLAGDGPSAGRAMARHIRSGEKYWSRVTVRLDGPPADTATTAQ